MSKKRQAPPKPEELIEKLDGKLESFKSEIVANLEEKTNQLEQLKATQTEDREKTEIQLTEIRGLSVVFTSCLLYESIGKFYCLQNQTQYALKFASVFSDKAKLYLLTKFQAVQMSFFSNIECLFC